MSLDARSRVLRAGLATSVINRGVAALIPLAMVPIALDELGADGFGAWASALSLTSLVVFADLGVGSGLMTKVGARRMQPDPGGDGDARALVSSAYVVVGGIVLVALGLLSIAVLFLDFGKALGAPQSPELELLLFLTLAGFILNVVVSLVVRVQYGVQQQAASNLWQAGASVASLGAGWAVASAQDSPGWFVAAVTFTPVLIGLVNSLHFYVVSPVGRQLAPHPALVRSYYSWELLGTGSRFLVVGVLMSLSLALDPWIVSHTSSLAEVPQYSIPFRVFAAIGSVSVMCALPLWPLHAQAVKSGDLTWITGITRKMSWLTSLLVFALCVCALSLGPMLLQVWTGEQVTFDAILWTGLALSVLVQTATGPAFMLQNGADVLGPQLWGYALLLLLIPGKIAVSAQFGYAWIPWVTVAGYFAFIVPACRIGYGRALVMAARRQAVESQ